MQIQKNQWVYGLALIFFLGVGCISSRPQIFVQGQQNVPAGTPQGGINQEPSLDKEVQLLEMGGVFSQSNKYKSFNSISATAHQTSSGDIYQMAGLSLKLGDRKLRERQP